MASACAASSRTRASWRLSLWASSSLIGFSGLAPLVCHPSGGAPVLVCPRLTLRSCGGHVSLSAPTDGMSAFQTGRNSLVDLTTRVRCPAVPCLILRIPRRSPHIGNALFSPLHAARRSGSSGSFRDVGDGLWGGAHLAASGRIRPHASSMLYLLVFA